MRLTPRIRRTITWAGPLLALFALCLWPLSYRFSADLQLDNAQIEYAVRMARGTIDVSRTHQSLPPDTWRLTGQLVVRSQIHSFVLGAERIPLSWGGSIFGYGPHITFPFWQIAILVLLPSGYLFIADRRAAKLANTSTCPNCSYDLTGLPNSGTSEIRCPECGLQGTFNHDRPRNHTLSLLPLWPWPFLWAFYWSEVILHVAAQNRSNHIAIAILAALALSTLTAAAGIALPTLRRQTPLLLMALYWLLGNYIFYNLACLLGL